jgi:hypothetical protein
MPAGVVHIAGNNAVLWCRYLARFCCGAVKPVVQYAEMQTDLSGVCTPVGCLTPDSGCIETPVATLV